MFSLICLCLLLYLRYLKAGVPNPPGCRLVLVHGLLGTGLHSRWWVMGERTKLHLPLPITRITAWTITPPLPTPPSARGKIVFHETGPWCQKVRDRCKGFPTHSRCLIRMCTWMGQSILPFRANSWQEPRLFSTLSLAIFCFINLSSEIVTLLWIRNNIYWYNLDHKSYINV